MSANKSMVPPLLEKSYGRLSLIAKPLMRRTAQRRRWYVRVRCSCGTVKEVRCDGLVSGVVESCGCLRIERAAASVRTHGLYKSKLYSVWISMRDRCYNQQNAGFRNYGARGIFVCEAWKKDFQVFAAWAKANAYREGLEIDRKDNGGPYSPDNCRFNDRSGQMRNARSTHFVEAFGERKCIAAWLEDPRCAVSSLTLRARLRSGRWRPEAAISRPPMTQASRVDPRRL